MFNRHDGVVVVIDNHYAAATGGQDVPSSRAHNRARSTNHTIAAAIRGVGGRWVRQVDRTYDVAGLRAVLRAALTTRRAGPKFVVAASECMLNRQRRERGEFAAAVKSGARRVLPRFGVDEEVCSGDHACIRLSGCPSLSLRRSEDPLKPDPVAYVDASCVGCGHCGEVAEAAVLCPSFYRADVVHNPTAWDRLRARWNGRVIAWLRRRRPAPLSVA